VEDIDEIVLVGRGKSVETFDWPDLPIAAVSSAIFIKQIPRQPDYWFVLDPARFFIGAPDGMPYKRWVYMTDPNVKWWDACNSEIEKHVPFGIPQVNPMFDMFRAVAPDNGPDHTLPCPAWDEFPNVTQWPYKRADEVNWDGEVIGSNGWANTLPFALQVLYRMGFRRVYFAGIEWSMPHWDGVRKKINDLRERSPLDWPALEV
jgi:hypothetical protein